jgi:hypothetical protein
MHCKNQISSLTEAIPDSENVARFALQLKLKLVLGFGVLFILTHA